MRLYGLKEMHFLGWNSRRRMNQNNEDDFLYFYFKSKPIFRKAEAQ